MLRLLIFLVGMLSTSRAGGRAPAPPGAPYGRAARPAEPDEDETWYLPREALPPRQPYREPGGPATRPLPRQGGRRRRRIPLKYKLAAVLVLAGLIFRKALAWAALAALAGTLHLVGINVHLPHIRLAWPWQSVAAGTPTALDVGPRGLPQAGGVSQPSLATA